MKKKYVIEFEYNEDAAEVDGTFGIADPNWQKRIGSITRDSNSTSLTEDLINMLDSGNISQAELMGLAVGGLGRLYAMGRR